MSVVAKIVALAGVRFVRYTKSADARCQLHDAKDQICELVWDDRDDQQQQYSNGVEPALRCGWSETDRRFPPIISLQSPSPDSCIYESKDIRQGQHNIVYGNADTDAHQTKQRHQKPEERVGSAK